MTTTNNNSGENYAQYGEVENPPNAAKLIQSLRHLNYDNMAAISDLIDNSIDANAANIWIDIIPGTKSEVIAVEVWDDGIGMDYETLNEALKLGSETGRNAACDLGLYGMGLITASISLGKRLEVTTKMRNSDLLSAVQDIDEMCERDRFVKTMRSASPEDSSKLAEAWIKRMQAKDKNPSSLPNSFTRVVVSKIDKSQWARAEAMAANARKRVGQVFRKFIQAGKCNIYVNDMKVDPIDPIYDHSPNILIDEPISMLEGDIRLVIVELKDFGTEINKEKGLNIPNQGFYILRNNREIASGESLGIFSKHNDYNLLRIEFSYPGTLDGVLNTDFTKQRIRLDQSVEDRVSKICNPFIRQVRTRAKQKQSDNREHKENFSDVEKFITQKSHLLKRPQVEVEERHPKTPSLQQRSDKKTEIEKPRLNIMRRHHLDITSLKVKFEQVQNGEKSPLWESDQERDRVIVRWNTDHPFYQLVVSPNAENPDVFNPLAYLIYCFANAELIAKEGSDSQEILDNIRWDVGRNLAILLK